MSQIWLVTICRNRSYNINSWLYFLYGMKIYITAVHAVLMVINNDILNIASQITNSNASYDLNRHWNLTYLFKEQLDTLMMCLINFIPIGRISLSLGTTIENHTSNKTKPQTATSSWSKSLDIGAYPWPLFLYCHLIRQLLPSSVLSGLLRALSSHPLWYPKHTILLLDPYPLSAHQRKSCNLQIK